MRRLTKLAILNGCITQLSDVKNVLSNINNAYPEDPSYQVIEDAIWQICDARDDLKQINNETV